MKLTRHHQIAAAFALAMLPSLVIAQKFISNKSTVYFFSSAPLEDIEATNTEGRSVFDVDNGEFVFSVPIIGFQFKKSLMQEHFNEKYLESDKYPKGTFIGKVSNYSKGDAMKDVVAEGTLELHGVKRQVSLPATLVVSMDAVKIESKFTVKLEDYNIKIPSLLFRNIAEEIEVTITFEYKPYGK